MAADPELKKEIENALNTGKYKFGLKDAVRAARSGDAKVIILAKNAPEEQKADVLRYAELSNIPIIEYDGTSKELGEEVCGRLHFVAAITFTDIGYSGLQKFIDQASVA